MSDNTGHATGGPPKPGFTRLGGALSLSNCGQLELLSEFMVRGLPLRMPVRGHSMQPFIQDRDVVTIVPLADHKPAVGDVVAFMSTNQRLVIHRVIATHANGVVLRGDNLTENDGLVPWDNLLGSVVKVERNGRRVLLGLGQERHVIAALNQKDTLMKLKQYAMLPKRMGSKLFRVIQDQPSVRKIFRFITPRITISRAAEDHLVEVHRKLNPYEPYQAQLFNPNLENYVALSSHRVIGFVQYIYYPDKRLKPWVGHWLFSLYVWAQYRGLGVGEALTKQVISTARQRGAAVLKLAVFEDNLRAIQLYEKLGFTIQTNTEFQNIFQADLAKHGKKRVLMTIKFNNDQEVRDYDHQN